jgi:multidrug efflux pump subunit AcrB
MSNVLKEFKLSTWAIHNKMTVYVIIVMIFLAGIFSYNSMPREAFPEIVVPEVFVSTAYPGNSALDIQPYK